MIIGIDASRANTDNRTGTEWYSWHVIQELKQIIPSEHTVRLYIKEDLKEDLAPLPANWDVRVLKWRPGLFWTQLRLSIEMLLHAPDVLYVPAHTIPVISPRNTVTVIHDVGFFTHPELYGKSELRYHRFSFNLAIKKAREIITISDFSLQEILKIAPQVKNRLHRIYNGLHTRTAEPDATILDRFHLEKQNYVLTISRVEEKKNAMRLTQAFAELCENPDFKTKLVFAGGLGLGSEVILEFVKQKNLGDRIIFTNYISDEEIVALLQHAQLFVFPSLYEGFGMPILEAMEKRIPVVCSDIQPLREIAADNATFFEPDNAHSIAIAIQSRLNDSTTYSEESLAKAQQHTRQFNWKHTAEATWKIIEKTLV
jgi:glycosyltransferase involved in cell wall biosynthesis